MLWTASEMRKKRGMVWVSAGTELSTGYISVLFRTKRQSHLSLCRYCCNCCKNKGCGFCCRF